MSGDGCGYRIPRTRSTSKVDTNIGMGDARRLRYTPFYSSPEHGN